MNKSVKKFKMKLIRIKIVDTWKAMTGYFEDKSFDYKEINKCFIRHFIWYLWAKLIKNIKNMNKVLIF